MKTAIILSCLCVMALSAPLPIKFHKYQVNVPSLVEIEAPSPEAAVRKARQLFDIDIDIYNNNGAGFFDNGDDYYGGGGGYGGYGGYGGGFGGYGGGYDGGYGGYGGGCCG